MPALGEQEEEMASNMPTATTKTTRGGSKGAKGAARKPATRKASPKTQRAKAARGRAASQTRASVNGAGAASRLTFADRSSVIGDYAERAVLIPVGVALTARDRVLSDVNGAISNYSTPAKAQAQLRRFERRGATARNRLEREVRKARVRFERQLRQRRRVIERTVGEIGDRRDNVAKNGTEIANELANRLQETVLSRV
jgi:hypothetical protein